MTINCTGIHTELVGVDMDGIEVNPSDYMVTNGSTIVTFMKEYLETLPVGEHTVTLRYTNNRQVTSKLEIEAASMPIPTPTVAPTEAPTPTPTVAPTATPTQVPTVAPTNTPTVDTDNDNDGNDDVSNNVTETTNAIEVSGQPATGDNSNVLFWSMLSMIALAGVAVIYFFYRKKY